MAKSKAKVARTTTEYDVSLECREGKAVAVIEAVSHDVYEDGRGYAGQSVSNRQVMVVPLMSLSSLAEQIVRTLAYDATADPEERYDLVNDAQRRIGLYSNHSALEPVDTFYTVAEARVALQVCPSGYLIAHIPGKGVVSEDDDYYRNVIESNP